MCNMILLIYYQTSLVTSRAKTRYCGAASYPGHDNIATAVLRFNTAMTVAPSHKPFWVCCRLQLPLAAGPLTTTDNSKSHAAAAYRSACIMDTNCSKHTSASWGPGDASG